MQILQSSHLTDKETEAEWTGECHACWVADLKSSLLVQLLLYHFSPSLFFKDVVSAE